MTNTFISKSDLAQAYFPYIDAESARHKLMQFINYDDILIDQLRETGYQPRSHAFSPAQVELIFARLGNPFRKN